MPLLQYFCKNCNFEFEELVKKFDDKVLCPKCGNAVERRYSGQIYSATGKTYAKCGGNCKTCSGCKR